MATLPHATSATPSAAVDGARTRSAGIAAASVSASASTSSPDVTAQRAARTHALGCGACAATRDAAARRANAAAPWLTGFVAAVAWLAFGAIARLWPNRIVGFADWAYTDEIGAAAWAVAAALAALAALSAFARVAPGPRAGAAVKAVKAVKALEALAALRRAGPWLVALPLGLAAWEILTAKTALLPTPFFAPPQALIEVAVDDWPRLAGSAGNTLKLLGIGFLYGAIVGFLVGVSIGWSRRIGYWVHPVLRVLGPVPATALLPLTFYFFPSSYSAAAFLIALATGFPVAVLTWSGVAGVNNAYYDVARTLGANARFLVLRVAIPAALPQVFVGLFMGLSASFTVLVTAEMMGVKSGLGWYLSWAQGWASYVNMYAALIVMALLFSGLITLLFAVRDRALAWQKGTVKW
ncbi:MULTISPECIES: ABC transporter permease [Burkholderia]|uniref:ABC transporter permease n=1 Tax=Burkholderia TaxID=32008 RepID=UPI000757283F|nr:MULTISPECIES: ABC transporter permease subunit [Burkholderia]AOJ71905.1 sulfonate ABC transporter permease [Burkholderia savannae]KVG49612.1 sulfonate ABC transporter permease [Burkholderia sp. MSMB0265]KVG83009.1 sulfonate ABC transporter permease [Burkholderia sp. MSMB2040]KVG93403.1 sulfonate ABC transporter permease [Burkholderia sp. MSMB2041]KVG97830.1 sulfonate ABC transporter permease [Burkholderia sp. MSMB2042]